MKWGLTQLAGSADDRVQVGASRTAHHPVIKSIVLRLFGILFVFFPLLLNLHLVVLLEQSFLVFMVILHIFLVNGLHNRLVEPIERPRVLQDVLDVKTVFDITPRIVRIELGIIKLFRTAFVYGEL